MRTTVDLLRIALADPEFGQFRRANEVNQSRFDVFTIDLPVEEFRGLPPIWTVLVLDPDVARDRNWSAKRIGDAARALLDGIPEREPVLVISDLTTVHLGDEFARSSRNVFCIDAANLPGKTDQKSDVRFSPFVLALQRRGPAFVYSKSDFMPYSLGKPASGWRFYGRKRELRRLVDSHENYLIIGSRRIGKTSLMQEAERAIRGRGEEVYYVNVQHRTNANEVSGDLLRALSPREMTHAIRHGEALGERPLTVALKRLSNARHRTTLLIDELGNLITNRPKDDWNFVGLLRNYAQSGNLRFVISCFQEVFLKQQQEFEGPLVNFANALRLTLFTESEVDDSFLAPFELWMNLSPGERNELRKLTASAVGLHPYFLQHFCSHLFEAMAQERRGSLLETAKRLVRADLQSCFESAVEEVFYHNDSAVIKYVFLLRCKEVDDTGHPIASATIDDDWLAELLRREGFSSTLAARRNILEGMEIRGLTASMEGSRSRQRIGAPIVYLYVKRFEQPIADYIAKLRTDALDEFISWGLAPYPSTSDGLHHD